MVPGPRKPVLAAPAVFRRVAAVAAALAVAGLALASSPPAQARPGATALQPLADEWWFAAWSIQSRVWPLTRGAGVTVAVLDTGVQASVPDLGGAVVPGGDTTGAGTNGMTDDDLTEDGHGTAMASLIAGQGRGTGLVGIAPKAKILPVRVGGTNGISPGGSAQTVAAGIRFAVNHGAQVINMSLGGPAGSPFTCDQVVQDAVAYALEHNIVLVAGAGNSRKAGNPPVQPASCAGVLAVGAVNPGLTLWSRSERQPYVAVTAPGNEIGWSGRDGRYFPDGFGTSQAAAFASGEAALVRSRYPSMPWQQVVQRIINTTLREGSTVPSVGFGYGIIRIAGAVNASRYPVAASAPDPVYAAYQRWLVSPEGTQFTSSSRQPPQAARSSPAAAPAPAPAPGGSGGLAAVIAVIAVVAAGGTALAVAVSRRRRRRHG